MSAALMSGRESMRATAFDVDSRQPPAAATFTGNSSRCNTSTGPELGEHAVSDEGQVAGNGHAAQRHMSRMQNVASTSADAR
jgi:hypothetical protein